MVRVDKSEYTEKGEFFLKQGRFKYFKGKGCVTLGIARYKKSDSNRENQEAYIKKNNGRHSEDKVLRTVKKAEKSTKSQCISLELYSVYSPCEDCCNLIMKFISQHPECPVKIAFSCMYLKDEKHHILALQKLRSVDNIKTLRVFTDKEWSLLKERGILIMSTQDLKCMLQVDKHWRKIFQLFMTVNSLEKFKIYWQQISNTSFGYPIVIYDSSEDIAFDGIDTCDHSITDHAMNTSIVLDENEVIRQYQLTKVDPEKVKLLIDDDDESNLGLLIMLSFLVVIIGVVLYYVYGKVFQAPSL